MNKKLFFTVLISITSFSYANSELISQQLENLKAMGIDTSAYEGTMQSLSQTFKEEEKEHNQKPASVQPNYYSKIGRPHLAKCDTGEVQLDTVCQASMLRHQAYLTAISKKIDASDINTLYEQHEVAAKQYVEFYDSLK